MLKIAIIGCGKIADSHASVIRRIKGCELVGVCDREELMARQLSIRFGVKHCFTEIGDLLRSCLPDVVHITTPPHSHFAIAKQCLEQGVHAYIEKPFTVWTSEAEELVGIAEGKNLKLTAGHDAQFSHVSRKMRERIKSGYLGGRPVHMESIHCYALEGHSYARAFLGDREHWVRKLPGGLLQNIISHGIARIAEYLSEDSPEIVAEGFVSPLLASLGEVDIVDELRVMIRDREHTTAYFTFSSQMRPSLHQFRIYGTRNGLLLDEDQQTLIELRGINYKSYLEKFIPQLSNSHQYLGNAWRNMRLFLASDFHMDSGKKALFELFYHSIMYNTTVPISYREILLTSRIMDSIFEQINNRRLQYNPVRVVDEIENVIKKV
jgi:predicted dehydrogenase